MGEKILCKKKVAHEHEKNLKKEREEKNSEFM